MTSSAKVGGNWLSPLSLSWRALGWFALIGVPAVLITIPDVSGSGVWSWRWWVVALAGQGACTAVAVLGRQFAKGQWCAQKVAAILIVAGAARGAVIAWVGQALSVIDDPSWLARIGNSVLVTLVLLGFLGAMIRSARDYDDQYRTLVERAVAVEVARSNGEPIDPEVLQSWSNVKGRIDNSVRAAIQSLDEGCDAALLRTASDLLRAAVDIDVRPASRELLAAVPMQPRRLRRRELLAQALSPWNPPIAAVVITLALIVGLGTFVRLGVTTAVIYTIAYLLAVAVTLRLSTALVRRAGFDRAVALTTLALLVPGVFLLGLLITQIPGVLSDPVGGALVSLQTPATIIAVSMVFRLDSERRAVLESLQQTIDAGTIVLLATDVRRRDDATSLGTFVHHSVQSELSALAIQLDEASVGADSTVMIEVHARVMDRLVRLEAIDPHQPPWLRASTGRERIGEIAQAWDGIAEVSLDVGPEVSGRPDQWHIAAQIVEEGLANAVRHGGARHIGVTAHVVDSALMVVIEDDGVLGDDEPGVGSRWLDSTVGKEWSLTVVEGRTRLAATIR